MFASSLSVGLAILPFVVGKVFDVTVGGPDAELVFSPPALSADVGDQVIFHFNPKNHSVTQSSFDSPCGRKEGGFTSGFHAVAPNISSDARPSFTVVVNDTNPVWIYCGQAAGTPASHCGQGMIFAINCPSDDSPNSLGNFKKAALAIGASLSASAASVAATAAATSVAAGYGGDYGAPPPAAASPTLTAAYGDVTIPPAVSETVITAAITMDASSVWTTVYTSFVNSPAATPVAPAGAVHTVVVGGLKADGSPQLLFNPDHLENVSPRDTVVFQFQQKNHSVVQSSFADPCRPLNINNVTAPSGFNSGFMPVPANETDFPTWSITVNDTAPIWAYCGQTTPVSHCGAGMVFAINAVDNSTRSYAAFVDVAKQLNGTAAASAGTPSDTAGTPSNTASGATVSGSNTGGALSLRGSSGVVLALVAVVASLL